MKKANLFKTGAGLVALALAGCAGGNIGGIERPLSSREKAAKVLNVDPTQVKYLQGDYMTSRYGGVDMDLRVIAGILAGTIKVTKTTTKTRDGYVEKFSANGYYNQIRDPEEFEEAIKYADFNKDKIVTSQEAYKAQRKILNIFANKR